MKASAVKKLINKAKINIAKIGEYSFTLRYINDFEASEIASLCQAQNKSFELELALQSVVDYAGVKLKDVAIDFGDANGDEPIDEFDRDILKEFLALKPEVAGELFTQIAENFKAYKAKAETQKKT